ncbi:nucleotidyl transferase AbiEii/AbiGii toxin family protein [Bdellovibrionota bacterium FG-2]
MKDLIQKKLEFYNPQNAQEEENALKEITQEVALYALAKSGFFEKASFQGGTCLRIVYGLDRFSEDLDFSLLSPNSDLELRPYLEKSAQLMKHYGYEVEVSGNPKPDRNVKMQFLKDTNIKRVLVFKHLSDLQKKINIKIEVDTNPPAGAKCEIKFLDFPTDYSATTHDLGSLFAGKIHALLCRPFVKGRDWYDLSWYVSQRVSPNYVLLGNALAQLGPWKDQITQIDRSWLVHHLSEKIESLSWSEAFRDVSPFLKTEKSAELRKLWSRDFFLSKLSRL